MTVYNAEPAIVDIVVTKGDTVDMIFTVYLNDVLYDMTGMQLDIDVRDKWGNLIKSYSSAGGSPNIIINTSEFNLHDSIPFTKMRKYKYDAQLTDGSDVSTFMRGQWIIQCEQTY